MQNDKITLFKIDVTQEVLSDLLLRLKNTRWSYQMEGTGWDAGTDLNYLKQLVAYWLDTYNWRERETAPQSIRSFQDRGGGYRHPFHSRARQGAESVSANSHTRLSGFLLSIRENYSDAYHPEPFGGGAEDAFDIVVPDLPGHGFSDKPEKPGAMFRVGDLWARLMKDKLGYERFGAHGGD